MGGSKAIVTAMQVIRDHTKRKVFEQYETQRYATFAPSLKYILCIASCFRSNFKVACSQLQTADKHSATSSAIPPSPSECAPKHNYSFLRCTPTPVRPRSTIDVLKEVKVGESFGIFGWHE